MEIEAGGLVGQVEIVEQPAYLRLRIRDKALVHDAIDAPGQHRVEMVEQLDIVAIIMAEIGQIVGEGLAAREMLLVVRPAAGERRAARVDDPRIGQDQMDEADVEPVVRQLVDETGPAERRCAAARSR